MMRRAMICVSAMLALLQLWPMVFGNRTAGRAATTMAASVPKTVPAVAVDTQLPRLVPVSAAPPAAPKSCYRQYKAHFARCVPGDQMCHVKAADDWDLCEATGFWPR